MKLRPLLNEISIELQVANLKKENQAIIDWLKTPPEPGKEAEWKEEVTTKMNRLKQIKQEFTDLTGNVYGNIVTDKQKADSERIKKNAKPAGVDDSYNSPEDVPIEVYRWLSKNSGLLTSDASDAVRWGRIINTKDEPRYSGEITVYRAVEPEYADSEIREGDWVTTEEDYAIQHNEKYFDGKGEILSMDVDGNDVLVSPTGNSEEAIYAPMESSIDVKF